MVFLHAGYLEELSFRPTLAGVPQGGIVSCVLANVYLHELDRYLAQYTEMDRGQRQKRKRQGLANFLYARYCDDFVVLCDGTKSHAEAMRQELAEFLGVMLKLELSMEKTRITHVSQGFILLGYQIEHTIGQGGKPVPKVRIPDSAFKRICHKIERVMAPWTCQDSVRSKIIALNRIIRGWCQYYQSTASPSVYFRRLNYRVFWKMAHWLGRKFKLSMPRVMRRFLQRYTFGTKTVRLLMPTEVATKWHRVRTIPSSFLSSEISLCREEVFALEDTWSGSEKRPGNADLRETVYARDGGRCGWCGWFVPWDEYQMGHIKPRHQFKRPAEADVMANLKVLHKFPCHEAKTKRDLCAVAA